MEKLNLKNYTSTVPAETSMARLEQKLVLAGATDISKSMKIKFVRPFASGL
jgi:hypothetical protein